MSVLVFNGNIGKVEEKESKNGFKYLCLDVAVGIGKDKTVWYKTLLWGDKWKNTAPYLKKGAGVSVTGMFKEPYCYEVSGEPRVILSVDALNIDITRFAKEEGEGSEKQKEDEGKPFETFL